MKKAINIILIIQEDYENEYKYSFKYNCSSSTLVSDLLSDIKNEVFTNWKEGHNLLSKLNYDYISSNVFRFYDSYNDTVRYFTKTNNSLLELIDYLKINYDSVVLYCTGGIGGMYQSIDGVSYFTHSNEENHKFTPHIHTEYKNKTASYRIADGEKLEGDVYPGKVEKMIKNKILSEKERLLKFWLDTTNGVYPLDYPFGIDIF